MENLIKLKDGRTLKTTHNGFRKFVIDKKGEEFPVTDEYYLKALRNAVDTVPFKKRAKARKISNKRPYGIF